MREAAREMAWVQESHLHLTLKFLGEQPDEDAEALGTALATRVNASRALRLALGGLGAFPNLRVPRVVWMGIERDAALELLHDDVERVCAGLGYEVDGRAFRPHITLGRVKRPMRTAEARALAAAARAVDYASTVPVASVDLMRSELTPAGSRYSVMAAIPLGGA